MLLLSHCWHLSSVEECCCAAWQHPLQCSALGVLWEACWSSQPELRGTAGTSSWQEEHLVLLACFCPSEATCAGSSDLFGCNRVTAAVPAVLAYWSWPGRFISCNWGSHFAACGEITTWKFSTFLFPVLMILHISCICPREIKLNGFLHWLQCREEQWEKLKQLAVC